MKEIELLTDFLALNDKGDITDLGLLMTKFPIDSRFSKIIIASLDLNCLNEILRISCISFGFYT
jgi:HrpA-like RNA helicase